MTSNFPCQKSRDQFKSKDDGKLWIHYCAYLETIETVYCWSTSVNLFSFYGVVAGISEESHYEMTDEFLIRAKRDQDKRLETIETIFRIVVSANQFSFCGEIA